MAPTKPAKGAKGKSGKGKSGGSSIRATKSKSAGSAPTGISKRKAKSMSLAKPGGAQRTKSATSEPQKKKKRKYSEKELGIPTLNGIVPAGVAKPKGQKIGKKFVDDPASLMAIMSVVNAEKEGHIESKIMKARHLEEIREAKKKEAEARSDEKKSKFEERKQDLKKKKNRHSEPGAEKAATEKTAKTGKSAKPLRKRVSFG
ncbi:hypothetical protein BDV95DRAFT_506672 [Massariosphaeria phaeospora]|uniref:60S ribosomal subunit assembly/export protein loc1 n=1 Tax=Massariosphaeria phaeospora TaxID=100035 RepID=A0A7C8I0E5_9PLEO|nr:hypothetical protein BDV95DRAFT_506672 [Massariosphaeria phaeospora]